ncbi:hypothetical protein AAC387_Pa06g0980 [Persea americana]
MSNMTKGLSRQHLEGIAAASVVIAIWFFIYRKGKESDQPNKRKTFHRSLTIGALHGGRLAMKRILDAQHARVDASVLDGAQAQLNLLLHQKPLDFIGLQTEAAKLEMSGKEDQALEMLTKALADANRLGNLHDAYELEMLAVEMLIYKGKYIEALDHKCLQDQEIMDARRPLYKTIAQIMLGHRSLAQGWWNEFQAIRRHFQWPDSVDRGPLHSVSQDFDEFERVVNSLKKEIDAIHGNRPN